MKLKECVRCKKKKTIDEFGINKLRVDQKSDKCKSCIDGLSDEKFCTNCSQLKSTEEFRRGNGVCKKCRSAHKEAWKKDNPDKIKNQNLRKFDITAETYNKLLNEQGGVCKICNKKESVLTRNISGRVKDLSVDHCHKTGIIRGLLCQKCNMGLGAYNDNIQLLFNAANYLSQFSADTDDGDVYLDYD